MKKKILAFGFLLGITIGVFGCWEKGRSDEIESSILESTSETTFTEEKEWSIVPTAAPDAQKPEEGFVISCVNYDYLGSKLGGRYAIKLWLVSEEELQTETITVSVDTDLSYTTSVFEGYLDTYYPNSKEQWFTYDVYQCYQNLDWKAYKALQTQVAKAHQDYIEETDIEKKEALEKVYLEINETYCQKYDMYEEYHKFLEEATLDTMKFYSYYITVYFDTVSIEGALTGERTIESVQVQIGEYTQVVDIGQITLVLEYPDFPSSYEDYNEEIVETPMEYGGAWSVGRIKSTQQVIGKDIMCRKANETIVIKEIDFYHAPQSNIEELRIHIKTENGIQSISWKEGRDVLIRAGEYFSVDIIFKDPSVWQQQYCGNRILMLEYEENGTRYVTTQEMLIGGEGENAPRYVYAENFHGIDLDSFYEYSYDINIYDAKEIWTDSSNLSFIE